MKYEVVCLDNFDGSHLVQARIEGTNNVVKSNPSSFKLCDNDTLDHDKIALWLKYQPFRAGRLDHTPQWVYDVAYDENDDEPMVTSNAVMSFASN